jgi:hypothetical protein
MPYGIMKVGKRKGKKIFTSQTNKVMAKIMKMNEKAEISMSNKFGYLSGKSI